MNYCDRCGKPDRPVYSRADRRRIGLAAFTSLVVLVGMTISDRDDRSQNQKKLPSRTERSGVISYQRAGVEIGTPTTALQTTTTVRPTELPSTR